MPCGGVPALAHAARRGADAGSATVWVLALCGVVLFAASAVVLVAGVRVDRHRAATAADLAALAGAERLSEGERSSCAAARATAEANGAELTRCRLAADLSLHVSTRVPARMRLGSVTAHARAGPHRSPWGLHGPDA
ncbi:Rv3654c family TadE-like protein [Streptomonospora wellingtoniae]|uniref:Flp pilus-assembly TadE/G-like family protein n=1 Tax=Streptomonospora wellingtoniae TaxID=3075544 RepID=A0ABU2KXP8_9ACTN|nr:Rv3654c family TadE-like protein [Streptomonospora sp. DSM 45055]MDT0304032.1 flp pilus-assembly TadE/G-like family protein [Streptomonospora sp. DSM 45055]